MNQESWDALILRVDGSHGWVPSERHRTAEVERADFLAFAKAVQVLRADIGSMSVKLGALNAKCRRIDIRDAARARKRRRGWR